MKQKVGGEILVPKKQFIFNIIVNNVIRASFGRGAKIYKEKVTIKKKTEIKEFIYCYLDRLFNEIRDLENGNNLEKKIKKKIKNLRTRLIKNYQHSFNDDKLNIGRTQKIINLFLKYLWCLGYIKIKPPFIPIDSQVINAINKKVKDYNEENNRIKLKIINYKWTEIKNLKQFAAILFTGTKVINNNLVDWEIKYFNDYYIRQFEDAL